MIRVWRPAKFNWFLAVGSRDERHYHPIRTVFQAIGLFDELTFEFAESDSIHCDWSDLPPHNTVEKALRLLREYVEVPPLAIQIHKRIPAQAGMGGGSSDAAGVLLAARHLARDPIPTGALHEIARAVGADVPFFLVGGRARGEGYGDQLTPLPDAPERWLVVAKPIGVDCPTGPAYAALDALSFPFREFSEEAYNDFERVMPCACDDWMELLQLRGAIQAGLCGSGSAVYGVFPSQREAEAALSRLRETSGAELWLAPTLTRAASLRIEISEM